MQIAEERDKTKYRVLTQQQVAEKMPEMINRAKRHLKKQGLMEVKMSEDQLIAVLRHVNWNIKETNKFQSQIAMMKVAGAQFDENII